MYVNENTSEALKSLLVHIHFVNTTDLAWYLADIHSTSIDNYHGPLIRSTNLMCVQWDYTAVTGFEHFNIDCKHLIKAYQIVPLLATASAWLLCFSFCWQISLYRHHPLQTFNSPSKFNTLRCNILLRL